MQAQDLKIDSTLYPLNQLEGPVFFFVISYCIIFVNLGWRHLDLKWSLVREDFCHLAMRFIASLISYITVFYV